MPIGTRRLGRLLRVRTLQHDLARADQVMAAQQAASTDTLVRRIERLVDDVAPALGPASALDLAAAAGLRARLHRSHADAAERRTTAQEILARREAATKAAGRNQGALEKLIDRAKARDAVTQMRALHDLPQPARRGTRLADANPERRQPGGEGE